MKTKKLTPEQETIITKAVEFNQQTLVLMEELKDEIKKHYDKWDLKIQAKQQPVAIQELDYWYKRLEYLISRWKEQ